MMINEKYDPDFQKSDDDFTIYIDPACPDFDHIIDDVKSLSFSVLEIIRDELAANRKEYFDFYNYDNAKKNEVLIELGEKIANVFDDLKNNEVDSQFMGYHFMELKFDEPSYILTNKSSKVNIDGTWTQLIDTNDFRTKLAIDNDTSAFRHDFGMKKSPDGKYHMLTPLDLAGSNKSPIFLSDNETLTFTKVGGTITSFILQRAKLNVKMFIQKDSHHNFTNIAGELIDVSIPEKNDNGLSGFYKKIKETDISHYVENYTFEYNGRRFNLNCYTIDYLIDDLGRMLFTDSELPWKDSKYAKRIRRLFLLYLIKLLTSNHTFDEIAGFFLQTHGIFGQDSYAFIQPFVSKFGFMKQFFENFFDLKQKIDKISDPVEKAEQMIKYEEYVNTVTDNFNFLQSVFKDQINISRTKPLEDSVIGAIVNRSIDNKMPITIEQLGGNDLYYYKKYLKYKGKYLREINKSYY